MQIQRCGLPDFDVDWFHPLSQKASSGRFQRVQTYGLRRKHKNACIVRGTCQMLIGLAREKNDGRAGNHGARAVAHDSPYNPAGYCGLSVEASLDHGDHERKEIGKFLHVLPECHLT